MLSVCPAAGEAGGVWRAVQAKERTGTHLASGGERDGEHSFEVAAQRARGQIRRYAVANRLNRLGTLTYGPPFCRDPLQLRRDVGSFWVQLRGALGGKAFPYLWVPELHKDRERWHVQFLVGKWIARSAIKSAWDHGFVHIKLLGDLPARSSAAAEARIGAKYTSKYVVKDLQALGGLHRYEVAQGFQPERFPFTARSDDEALHILVRDWFDGEEPETIWRSREKEQHDGPPMLWTQWAL